MTVYEEERPLRVEAVATTPAARVSLAGALLDKGHMTLAEREVRMALHENPESAQGHLVLGLIAMRRSQWAEAAARLYLAVRLDPSSAAAWVALAQVERQRRHPEAALPAVAGALRCCDEAGERANLLVLRGEVLAELGRGEEAMRSVRQALALVPDSDGAHRVMARLLWAAGDWKAARQHAERAIRLNPAAGPVRQILGDALYESGDFGAALWQYTLSLPSSPRGYRRAASWNEEQGYLEEALSLLRSAVFLHPDDIATWLALARVYARLHREAEAIALCEVVLRREPDHAEARGLRERIQAARAAS
jgi:tetratricopeptide (TPR) repeat protein